MNCHAVRAVSDLHAEGRLSAPRAAAVAAHLAGCAACRGAAAPAIAASATASAPSALKAKLLAAAKAARPEPAPVVRPLSLLPRDAASVAAAAVALALVALIAGFNGAPNQSFYARDEIAGRTR